jgi:hypothetical protein
MIFTAVMRGSNLCIMNEANLLAWPDINEGLRPSLLKHSLTTSSGFCAAGASRLTFPGFERI